MVIKLFRASIVYVDCILNEKSVKGHCKLIDGPKCKQRVKSFSYRAARIASVLYIEHVLETKVESRLYSL